jgi:hypothetical protein
VDDVPGCGAAAAGPGRATRSPRGDQQPARAGQRQLRRPAARYSPCGATRPHPGPPRPAGGPDGGTERLVSVQADVRSLLAQAGNDDPAAADSSQILALLDDLDHEITGLLESQPGPPDQARWLAKAKNVLRKVGRLLVAVGTAMAVASGAMLAAGGHPAAPDELQAAAGLVIGAACGLLQRDARAVWQQPDISVHLDAARELLGQYVAELCDALQPGPDTSPGGNAPPSREAIASVVVQVQFAAYSAAILSSAADGLGAGFLREVAAIARDVSALDAAAPGDAGDLARVLWQRWGSLDAYPVKGGLSLRPEARLSLLERILAMAIEPGKLRPPIRPAAMPAAPENTAAGEAPAGNASISPGETLAGQLAGTRPSSYTDRSVPLDDGQRRASTQEQQASVRIMNDWLCKSPGRDPGRDPGDFTTAILSESTPGDAADAGDDAASDILRRATYADSPGIAGPHDAGQHSPYGEARDGPDALGAC